MVSFWMAKRKTEFPSVTSFVGCRKLLYCDFLELAFSQKQELDEKKSLLYEAMKVLNEREKTIIEERKLANEPKTLEELSKKYKVSRERIRQIEIKAFEKLQKSMLNSSRSKIVCQKTN